MENYSTENGSPAELRHCMGSSSLGHLCWWYHHVQVILIFHFHFHSVYVQRKFLTNRIKCRNLPRHQFGNLQGKMFPAYFAMVGVCEAACLSAFGMVHPWSSASTAPVHKLQILLLLSSLLFTLSNLLIFTPLTMNVSLSFSLH